MVSRDDIIAAVPIVRWLKDHGIETIKQGKEYKCLCPFHADKNPSMRINEEKGMWCCDPCGFGGTVIDLEFRHSGGKVKEAMRKLALGAGLIDPATEKTETQRYIYRDALGRQVMGVDRKEKLGLEKKFIQWKLNANGEQVFTLDGVERVLYRMDKWTGKAEVHLCEGEKCADAVVDLGFDATSNPGGSNGWVDAYSGYLKNMHVNIWPDNDKSGAGWLDSVLKSLEGKVESLRVLRVPSPYCDVADVLQAQGNDLAGDTIAKVMQDVARVPRGIVMPLLSSEECFELYRKRVLASDNEGIDFGRWLKGFRDYSRPLLPGDMAVFLSDTGVGKTTILTNLAVSQAPRTTIFFELELSAEAMCERFVALTCKTQSTMVERMVKEGKTFDVQAWKHVWVCPESKMSLEQMEAYILRSELRTQSKPRMILIDYIGLMSGGSGKRYERLSTIAEGLKVLAKTTNTVVVVCSQIKRREEGDQSVGLHDAKDSGSIECSAQLVVSAVRPSPDSMTLSILKQTKKAGGGVIECWFNGDRQEIWQKGVQ
jgi:hypothetical protein